MFIILSHQGVDFPKRPFCDLQGVPQNTESKLQGYKTVIICSNKLKFTERNVKILNDTHTKHQVNRLSDWLIILYFILLFIESDGSSVLGKIDWK